MTPFRTAKFTVDHVSRFVASFHPRSLQPMLRANYARELMAWSFIPVMLAGLQQGTMSIILIKTFSGMPGTTEQNLGLAVGTISAAAAIGNLTSSIWATVSWGHAKVRLIVWLMVASSLCVGAIALVPANVTGAWLMVGLVLVGWVFWSGVITIRTTVWRTNYPSSDRTSIAGRLASVQAIVLAASGFIIGWLLDEFSRNDSWSMQLLSSKFGLLTLDPSGVGQLAFRIIFPALAFFGVLGALIYARVRLRGQNRLARAERAGAKQHSPSFNPLSAFRVLKRDPRFLRYMICQFILGTGNLMMFAPLVLILNEQFDASYLEGILVTTIIPLVLMPLVIPGWARLLARMHVISFRAIHSWLFVVTGLLFFAGSTLGIVPLIVLGSVVMGIAFGGGVLAWNLGHQHFARPEQDSLYMSVHVTLTGVRGIIGPYLGVLAYEWLSSDGNGGWVFACSALLTTMGAIGFVLLRHVTDLEKSSDEPA
jgi:MFS family permease